MKRVLINEGEERKSSSGNNVEDSVSSMPKKRFFRSRAHCNPLSHNDGFEYPNHPEQYADSWRKIHYPGLLLTTQPSVDFLDIGMGFGGLTVALAEHFPDKLVLGMEIRAKVCEYVRLRIEALRKENPGQFQNASCMRTNCMRYLPNYFRKHQLEKIFFCFPDPHFKAKNHRRRIISLALLTEYAYFLKPGGRLYTITDVLELHQWHMEKCNEHPLFALVACSSSSSISSCSGANSSTGTSSGEREKEEDVCIKLVQEETEEGKKVARLGGRKHFAVFRRLDDDEMIQRQYSGPAMRLRDLWELPD